MEDIPVKEIFNLKESMGRYSVCTELPVTSQAYFDLASHIAKLEMDKIKAFGTPILKVEDTFQLIKYLIGNSQEELFFIIYLSNKRTVLNYEVLFKGTIDSAIIHNRIVMKRVLETNANSVIFAHNHPSNQITESRADVQITEKLKNMLRTVDVTIIDHIIVAAGSEEYTSLAGKGLL